MFSLDGAVFLLAFLLVTTQTPHLIVRLYQELQVTGQHTGSCLFTRDWRTHMLAILSMSI